MQNQYIVDAFLSGALWSIVTYLTFEVRARVLGLSKVMDSNVLSAALAHVAKKASIMAIPFWLFFIFLLWRFYGLMVDSQTWGAGGAGLIAGLFVIGLSLIWLSIILMFVRTSGFMTLAHKVHDGVANSQHLRGTNDH